MVWTRVHRLYQHPEETEQYGHLDNQRPETTHRVDTGLPVQPHRLLGHPLTVPAVALLDFPHPRLQVRHGLHLPQLLDGQRQRHQPHDDGEQDDGDAHVAEADGVEHHQQVQQGPYYYFSPEVVYTQKGPTLPPARSGKPARSGRTVDSVDASVALHALVMPAPHLHLSALDFHSPHASVIRTHVDRFAHGHQRRLDLSVPQALRAQQPLRLASIS